LHIQVVNFLSSFFFFFAAARLDTKKYITSTKIISRKKKSARVFFSPHHIQSKVNTLVCVCVFAFQLFFVLFGTNPFFHIYTTRVVVVVWCGTIFMQCAQASLLSCTDKGYFNDQKAMVLFCDQEKGCNVLHTLKAWHTCRYANSNLYGL